MIRNSGAILPREQRHRQGVWLFLAMLAVFFASCMILFAIYVVARSGTVSDAANPLQLPRGFIGSTFLLIGVGMSLNQAVRSVRDQRLAELQRWIVFALVLSLAFLVVQAFGLFWLLRAHFRIGSPNETIYGLTFFLAFLHALHVVGGVVAIGWVAFKSSRKAYDHEHFGGVEYCTWYWHFLDIVWLIMIASFWLAAAYLKIR